MAYLTLHPTSAAAERRLSDDGDALTDLLQAVTQEVLGVPEHDVVVESRRCTTMGFNRTARDVGAAPDVVIKIATSDRHLEPRFHDLCSGISRIWDEHFESVLTVEVWVSVLDAWTSNIILD